MTRALPPAVPWAVLAAAVLLCPLLPPRPADAAPVASGFALTGAVDRPAAHGPAELQALPSATRTATHAAGGRPVSATHTGAPLRSLPSAAGPQAPAGATNGTPHDVVVAADADGHAAASSAGGLDPRFGGSATRPDPVAHAATGAPLGGDGFARPVVPGDAAGGRHVSDPVSLEVLDATAAVRVPEPGAFAPPCSGSAGLAAWCGRRATTGPRDHAGRGRGGA